MVLADSPATTSIVASLPREKQGVASAINDVSRELGGAPGIAVLGSVLNTAYRSGVDEHTSNLPTPLAYTARGSLGAAQAIGHRLGASDLVTHANTAFVHGISLALLAGAAALIGGAAFVALRAPGRAESKPTPAAQRRPPSHTPNPPDPTVFRSRACYRPARGSRPLPAGQGCSRSSANCLRVTGPAAVRSKFSCRRRAGFPARNARRVPRRGRSTRSDPTHRERRRGGRQRADS
jgi:hypothetical protein